MFNVLKRLAEALRKPQIRQPPTGAGQLVPGNIGDLDTRPMVSLPDGGWGTIYSVSFPEDHRDPNSRWVLAPSIYDGKLNSPDEAEKRYRKTGLHLGIFGNMEQTNEYARSLSDYQGTRPDHPEAADQTGYRQDPLGVPRR